MRLNEVKFEDVEKGQRVRSLYNQEEGNIINKTNFRKPESVLIQWENKDNEVTEVTEVTMLNGNFIELIEDSTYLNSKELSFLDSLVRNTLIAFNIAEEELSGHPCYNRISKSLKKKIGINFKQFKEACFAFQYIREEEEKHSKKYIEMFGD